MGMFDFMFEDDGSKGKKKKKFAEEPVQATEEVKEEPTPAPAPVQQITEPPPVAGEVDESIKQQLVDVLLKSNLEGYDYLEFRDSLSNMAAVIPSEPDRFKAAYAAVASIVSIDKLTETADFYLSQLDKKKAEFEEAAQQMFEQNVTSKEEEVTSIDDAIAQKQEEITKLNQEIAELQTSKVGLQNEAITEKAKIERVNLNFQTTFGEIQQAILHDKTKIATYLGVPKAEEGETNA